MRKVDGVGFEEQLSFLPVDDILYIFTTHAISSSRSSIEAKWLGLLSLPPGKVYARTEKGLFVTEFRTLTQILARLKKFRRIHKSIAFNVTKIKGAVLNSKRKQIAVLTGEQREWLDVSRRALRDLLRMYGMAKRSPTMHLRDRF